MKKVTVKEFSRNTYKYLKALPVLITKHGKSFAKVIKDETTIR